jgi:hypothetical protein
MALERRRHKRSELLPNVPSRNLSHTRDMLVAMVGPCVSCWLSTSKHSLIKS